MIKKTYIVIFIMFWCWVSGCKKDNIQLPFEKEKTIRILADIHVAEAAARNLYVKPRDSMLNLYYDQICMQNEIARPDLDTALNRLRHDPYTLKYIYPFVIAELEKRLKDHTE